MRIFLYTVYEHINKINSKRYIRITSRIPEERWGHNGCSYKSSPHFYSAIEKYGWDNFDHNILYKNLSKEKACDIEKKLIKKYNTQNRDHGYNVLEGAKHHSFLKKLKIKCPKQ